MSNKVIRGKWKVEVNDELVKESDYKNKILKKGDVVKIELILRKQKITHEFVNNQESKQ